MTRPLAITQPLWLTATTLGLFVILVLWPSVGRIPAFMLAVPWRELLEHLVLDGRQLRLLGNSLAMAAGAAGLAVVLGVPLAFLLARTDLPGRRLLRVALLLPLLVPSHVQAIAWLELFPLRGIPGSIFVLTLAKFPFVLLLALAGFASVDRRLEEAARAYADGRRVFREITLPLVRPFIAAGAIFVFVFAITDYGVPALLQLNTYPVEIFAQFSAFYDEAHAAVLAIPLLLITTVLVLVQQQLMGRRTYVMLGFGVAEETRLALGRWRIPALLFVAFVLGLAVVVPILALVSRAGSWEVMAIALRSAYGPLLTSLGVAATSATVTLILCFPVAYFIERGKGRVQRLWDILSVLPFAVPATLTGMGLIQVWNRSATEGIYGSALMLGLACFACFSPFAIRILSSALKQVNPALEEAALVSNGAWHRRLGHIVLPLSRPGLLAAWLFVFVLSLGELGATLLVIPAGWETLSLRVYNLIHYGAHDIVAALSLLLIGFSLLVLGLAAALMRVRRR